MRLPHSSQELYDQLMDKDAFEQGHYEVAYHVLAAALHCALLLKGQGLLTALPWKSAVYEPQRRGAFAAVVFRQAFAEDFPALSLCASRQPSPRSRWPTNPRP
jgi:hypothetical protein